MKKHARAQQIGWLWREPEPGFRDLWHACLGPADAPTKVFEIRGDPTQAIEWLDKEAGGKIRLEETLNSQMGYRVFLDEQTTSAERCAVHDDGLSPSLTPNGIRCTCKDKS